MNKLIKIFVNPIWAFKRVYIKFIANPKYKRLNYRTHNQLMIAIDKNYKHSDYIQYANEIANDYRFINRVKENSKKYGINVDFSKTNKYSWIFVIYYVIRKHKPEVFIETGVWYGCSTAIILYALAKNKKGYLHSIDLPAYYEKGGYYDENPYRKEEERNASLPAGAEPGFIVPEYLKERWKLILGDSKTELPKLLNTLENIDMFLHDSLHSYDNMIFEFSVVMKKLKAGSFMFSDNIDWNNAFFDFSINNNRKHYTYLAYYESSKLKHNFGVIKNEKLK